MTAPLLGRALRQCQAKDPDDRRLKAIDLRRELAWLSEGGSRLGTPAPVVTARRRRREWPVWTLAAAGPIAAGAAWAADCAAEQDRLGKLAI